MNANDRQVAGTHYRTTYQHWDLAHYLDLGYFEGQISKYITRHRSKKGREDAEKALHFAQKLTELAKHHGQTPRHKFIALDVLKSYCDANDMNIRELSILRALFQWEKAHHMEDVCYFISELIRTEYGAAPPEQG